MAPIQRAAIPDTPAGWPGYDDRVDPSEVGRLAREIYLTAAAPALVREAALLLAPFHIPLMPLKGALLQRLVYKDASFRSISDVDVLVPAHQFAAAYAVLRAAGFSEAREEPALWEVALRRPKGLLELDLHQRLSATTRSRLRPHEMFARGRADDRLFEAPVILPDPHDLYAHLLLHMTIHWVNERKLHHAEDLEAVPEALGLSPAALAHRLVVLGLGPHAGLVLPLLAAQASGRFSRRLLAELRLDLRSRVVVSVSRRLSAMFSPGMVGRRSVGFLLAPSWLEASRDALSRRMSH
jgi:hypothetical protein